MLIINCGRIIPTNHFKKKHETLRAWNSQIEPQPKPLLGLLNKEKR